MASRPPEHVPSAPDAARARFFIIGATRITGVALIVIGLLILNGKVDWPDVVGWVFLAVGLIDVFVMPRVLARRWRTPPE
ncbi:hypothetical protein ACWPM1_04615 [Tsuneonella sp. HG249]